MSRLNIVTLCYNCAKGAAIDRHREQYTELKIEKSIPWK